MPNRVGFFVRVPDSPAPAAPLVLTILGDRVHWEAGQVDALTYFGRITAAAKRSLPARSGPVRLRADELLLFTRVKLAYVHNGTQKETT